MTNQELVERSTEIRRTILKLMHLTKNSHIGSCFSATDILTTLYFGIMNVDPKNQHDPQRDIFILSKGHAAVLLYATLAHRGFFKLKELDQYGQDGSKIAGHVIYRSLPGVEATSGSLGHGLSLAAGMALSGKINRDLKRRYYCLLGDGECNEGSVWEAAMFSGQHKLNNLIAVIDFNRQQGLGDSSKILNLSNMAERWSAFGWEAIEIDGHDFTELLDTFKKFKDKNTDRPSAIIARTVKGKGVSWMENSVDWHYKSPNDEQYRLALEQLT